MNFVIDSKNYNVSINLSEVVGIVAPDVSSKNGKYYIQFYTKDKSFFWFYDSKNDRDFVYNNYFLPMFHQVDSIR